MITLYDLPTIFTLREAFAELDPTAASRAIIPGNVPAGSAIGILAGSFDPLTNAHVALAQTALAHGGIDAAYFALSRHTVNKESRQRPTDADRALTLRCWLQDRPQHSLILFNRGLYADQAVAARTAFPQATTIRFIVGFDKAAQIFDPRYYDNRDDALRALFGAIELLVAPRGDDGAGELLALLDRPENRPFRDAVHPLPFDPTHADASSTVVREAIRAGQPIDHLVPPQAATFVRELVPYDPPSDDPAHPDRYALRQALIAALAADRAWSELHADLESLIDQAVAPATDGEQLRLRLAGDSAASFVSWLRSRTSIS